MLTKTVGMHIVSARKEVVEKLAHVTALQVIKWTHDLAIFRQLCLVRALRLLNVIAVIRIARKGDLTTRGRASCPAALEIQLLEEDGHLRGNVLRSGQAQLPSLRAGVVTVRNVGRSGRVHLVRIDADLLAKGRAVPPHAFVHRLAAG